MKKTPDECALLLKDYSEILTNGFKDFIQRVCYSETSISIRARKTSIVQPIGTYLAEILPILRHSEGLYAGWVIIVYWIHIENNLEGPSPLHDFNGWIQWAKIYIPEHPQRYFIR